MPKQTLREIAYRYYRRLYGPKKSKRKTDEYMQTVSKEYKKQFES